jgi:hypothetical protein
MPRLLLFFLLGLLPTLVLAQAADETFEAALLQTKTGAMLVYNGSQHAFSVQFTGRVEPSKNPNFLTLNGQVVQAAIIGYGSNGDVSDLPEDTQKKFLLSYQQHEGTYFRKELKVPITDEKTTFVRHGNHLFLSWTFGMLHRTKAQVKQQFYLVAICFNQALVLNCPVTTPAESIRAQQLLAAIADTLVLHDEPVDLTKLYKELHP